MKLPIPHETISFEDAFEYMPKSGLKAGEGKEDGKYKFFTSSSEQTMRIDEVIFDGEFLIFGTGGNPSVHHVNGKFSTSTDCWVVKTRKNDLEAKYVYYFFKGNSPLLERGFRGAGLRHLSRHYLNAVQIPKPPLETQLKIISILEKAEKLKETREEADELTTEFLKSVFYEMFGDLHKNTKRWDIVKFSKLGSLERGKSKHRPRNDPKLLGGPYPLVQTGEVANSNGYITKYTQTYSEIGLRQSRMWSRGTLCITIAANIAKTGILTFDACFPDSIVGFKPNSEIRTEYIQFWLATMQRRLEEFAPESAQKNINLAILSNLDVPTPSLSLQNKFAKIVEEVESLKRKQADSNKQIDNLFGVLMRDAFNGEAV